MTNVEYADSLRQVADFYEAHPDMPIGGNSRLCVFTWGREEFLRAAVELAKGGKVLKMADQPDNDMAYYHVMRTFGQITVDVRIPRETVCRLVSPAVYECPDSLLEEFSGAV